MRPLPNYFCLLLWSAEYVYTLPQVGLLTTKMAINFGHIFGAGLSQFHLSVSLSVCHSSDPRLNGSRYRDVIYTTQCVDARGLLRYRVLRYGALV